MSPENQQSVSPATPPADSSPSVITPASDPPASSPLGTPVMPTKRKRRVKLLVIVVGILIALLGASSAAYFAVIAPNKPDRVVKAALKNTFQQRQMHFDLTYQAESTDTSQNKMPAIKAHIVGQADLDKKISQGTVEVTASGVTFPFEVRMVDGNVYIRVGDLNTIKAIISQSNPDMAQVVSQLSKKLSNQWVVIDSTLLNQGGGSNCNLTDVLLTDEDVDLLIDAHQRHPFISVVSSANDNVNGQAARKIELSIDDNKGADYVRNLPELSFTKKLRECAGDQFKTEDIARNLADNDHTPLTVWVDKATKRIVKLAGHTTAQDEQQSHVKGSFEMTVTYEPVEVSKPDGAKPIMEFLSDFSSLFLGGDLGQPGQSTRDGSEVPGVSQECLQQLQAYANSGGSLTISAECQ